MGKCIPLVVTVITAAIISTGCDNTYYANCAAAEEAGAAPVAKDDPGYRKTLDRDGDGVACDG